ncbi:hypothetical protein ACR77U_13110 [Enterococcus faecium]|uniref:hypothetical protein n=1 Tax=Enterococcus faecium TaxID=1352 RepID=UPI003DA582E1
MTEEKEKELREQLHEILDIVLDTNGLESRSRAKTGTLPTVFIDFSGHVSKVDVSIHRDGWTPSVGYDKQFTFYFDEKIDQERIEELRAYCKFALEDKTELDVIDREIDKRNDEIASQKKIISDLKRERRKKARKMMKEAK